MVLPYILLGLGEFFLAKGPRPRRGAHLLLRTTDHGAYREVKTMDCQVGVKRAIPVLIIINIGLIT